MKLYEIVDKKYIQPIKSCKTELLGWEKIEIKENNEELVSLKKINSKISVSPQYFLNKIDGAEPDCKVRKTIAEKLITIANKLPENYKLLVWDSYRAIKTQQALFDFYFKNFEEETGIKGAELMEYTKKFVAVPSTDKLKPSPHNTGGAIDLTICDLNNTPINLGTYFDDFRLEAYTDFYEIKQQKMNLTDEENEILLNRRILCNLFEEEGFVNYPYEIWHKSYGDQMHAKILNKKYAIYGAMESK